MTDGLVPNKEQGPLVGPPRLTERIRRKGNDNLKLAIIAYAKARPCLWDNNVHYSKNQRDEAWRSFSEGFSLPVSELRKRWEGMRQVYCQHLKESIANNEVVKWSYFSKLDDFLRTPTLRIWQKEGAMPEGTSKNHTMDIELIDLSSDSEGEPSENTEAPPGVVKRVDSSEKPIEPGTFVPLQTEEDIRNELRKIPPVAGSVGGLQKEKERRSSLGVFQQSKPSAVPQQSKPTVPPLRISLGVNKKRKSLPDIPDAKRRMIQNCGELIALKKLEPSDNLSRSLPLGNASAVNSPPHKMFGSTPSNIARNHRPSPSTAQSGKSLLKKMKQKMEKRESKSLKKRVSAPAAVLPSTSTSGALVTPGDAKKVTLSSEITKLPSCNPIAMQSSGAELPRHLTPSTEGVASHSVPTTTREEPRAMNQNAQEGRHKEYKKSKKNKEQKKEEHRKKIKHREEPPVVVLDNSDTDAEVTTSVADLPNTSTANPDACQQNGLEHDKKYGHKTDPQTDTQKTENDLLKKWAEESKQLCKTEDEPKVEEEPEKDDLETAREVRKNFLLSFLPDMAEMTVEQRRFFKSKLMYLVCNIDQFS